MTNLEKYKTAEERGEAFRHFCWSHDCEGCHFYRSRTTPYGCLLYWLEMEAEEELLPCPFCGGTPRAKQSSSGFHYVQCNTCDSMTWHFNTKAIAIATWNRRAK